MSKLRILLSVLLFSSMFVFTSCGKDEDDNPFVGTWTDAYWEITLVFKSDMSGMMKGDETTPDQNFTYSYTETELSIELEGDPEIRAISYTLSGSTLTLIKDGMFTYNFKKE